jgi:hyperosmotically inducible protein
MTTIATLGLVLALAAGAAAQKRKEPKMERNVPPAAAAERARYAVAREVRHELLTMPYYGVFDWIRFEVQQDGTVVLDGKVTRPTIKSRAEKAASDVEGVTRVVNRIDVLPPSGIDDQLRLRLYREVYSGPLFKYQVGSLNTIHIIVDHGRVTLEGVVNSSGDRTIAYVRANSVPGIFAVTNNLEVVNGRDDE